VLAAGLWSTGVEASLPGASAVAASDSLGRPSLDLRLGRSAAASPTDSGFALFAGDELGRALGQGDGSARFALGLAPEELDADDLALASRVRELRPDLHRELELLAVEPLRGPPECEPKTRIGGLEPSGPFAQREQPRLTLGLKWRCGPDSCEIASGQRFDPLGLAGPQTFGNLALAAEQAIDAAEDTAVRNWRDSAKLIQGGGAPAAFSLWRVLNAPLPGAARAAGIYGAAVVVGLAGNRVVKYSADLIDARAEADLATANAAAGQQDLETRRRRKAEEIRGATDPRTGRIYYTDPDSPFYSLINSNLPESQRLHAIFEHNKWVEEKERKRRANTECSELHHVYPVYLGGPAKQRCAPLSVSEHDEFHRQLVQFENGILRPEAGRTGSDIVDELGEKGVEEALERFVAKPEWRHLQPYLRDAMRLKQGQSDGPKQ